MSTTTNTTAQRPAAVGGGAWDAGLLRQWQQDTTGRPLLLTGARVITLDPVVGDFDPGDVLLGGPVVVGVGPGLVTAAGDDGAVVVDCAGLAVVPAVLDTAALVGHRGDRAHRVGTLLPGSAADLAVVRAPTGASPAGVLATPLTRPEDVVALITRGEVVRWGGVDVVATTAADRARRPAQDLARDPRVGTWVDETGFLHQELTADGRYDETRGGRPHAFTGRYWVDGDRVDYLDDLGFWAYGVFTGDRLLHAGYTMRLHGARQH